MGTHLNRGTYESMPAVTLDSLTALCPRPGAPCPSGEPSLAATRPDGTVAVAYRDGSVHLLSATGSARQIGFERSAAPPGVPGGHLSADPQGHWRLLRPGGFRYVAFDDAGREVSMVQPPVRLDAAGLAANGEFLVRLLMPPGERDSDTVVAPFEVVAPRARLGELIASVRLPATRAKGSDLHPLPPFFTSARIWGVTPEGTIFHSSGEAYEVALLRADSTVLHLRVDAPRQPVDTAALAREADKFMAMMPAAGKFREAAQADVDRRVRTSSRYHPAIVDLRVTASGELFVRGTADQGTALARWDVYSPALEPRGYFVLDDLDRLLIPGDDSLLIATVNAGGNYGLVWMWRR